MGNHFQKNNLQRVLGALQYGGTDAFMGVLYHMAAPITQLIDCLHISNKHSFELSTLKGIIISSPPRSGSTMIYQAITCALPCMPYTNLHFLFPRHASAILRKSKAKRLASRTKFKNYHGYTSGLFDVNEANNIFSFAHKTISTTTLNKKLFERIEKINPGPEEILVFKNVMAYNVLSRIFETEIGKRFIFIRIIRDPQAIIESVYQVYKETKNFQPVPDNVKSMVINDPLEFAYNQITSINTVLDAQFERIPKECKFVIEYEDFCENPYIYLQDLAFRYLKIPDGSIKKCEALDSLKASKGARVSKEEAVRIKNLLNHN